MTAYDYKLNLPDGKFYVRDGATTTVTRESTSQTGQIQITKISADDNPYQGFAAVFC